MTKVLVGVLLVLVALAGTVGAIMVRSGGDLAAAIVFWVLIGTGGLLLLRSSRTA